MTISVRYMNKMVQSTRKNTMKNDQLQTLKGFRDFLPEEKRKRDVVAGKIKTVFERFGFAPLETPTLEYASLLLGKYGDEADKLVYSFQDRGEREVALRYDQTVPTARVLAQYQNELPKYFRRYQMQNVFRADKPQKGRFREFAQCDADIFSNSSIADAEILAVYYFIYQEIGLTSIKIEVNDRQTLIQTLSEFANDSCDVFSIIQSIDKLDKMSPEDVAKELMNKGISEENADNTITAIETAEMSDNLRQIIDQAVSLGVKKEALVFNPKIARGLDYYTGLIFEGRIPEYTVGSVGGGGRYDKLIEQLSGVSIPAVGFGLGFDRTVEAADQLDLIKIENTGTQVLVTVFNDQTLPNSLVIAKQLRQADIRTEVYPDMNETIGKQLQNAEKKGIQYAVIAGEEEIQKNLITVKNIQTRDQKQVSVAEFIQSVS